MQIKFCIILLTVKYVFAYEQYRMFYANDGG
jgi:hypothetical protein